jgi:signal peptidase II
MNRNQRIILISLVIIFCIFVDQLTKSIARDYFHSHGAISFAGDTFRLQYAENPGAFLSLGADLPIRFRAIIFTIGSLVIIAAALVYTIWSSTLRPVLVVSLSLICGGGIGNLIDRFCFAGYVTDFLNVGIGPIRTGIFNVADLAMTVGVALFLLWSSRSEVGLITPRAP